MKADFPYASLFIRIILSLAGTLCLSLPAYAVLEEVVVTAQKREQDISEVSVAVTAFSGEALRELGMTNSVDIAGQTPGLNIGTPVGEGNNPAITLRGVGLNDFNDNNEGPIAVYRDEVYQAAMPGLTFQLFDMERVEVLRGPQGTLYGRNATGGLVHFITAKPSAEPGGYAELSLGEYSQVKFEGALGGPVTKNSQLRVSVASNHHDGYVENRINTDGNEANNYAIRGQYNIDFTDKLSVLGSVHWGKTDTVSPKYQHEVTDFDGDGVPDATDLFGYTDTDDDNFAGDYDRNGVLYIENLGYSFKVNYSGEKFDFVSITGYEEVDKLHQEDTDMGPFPAIEPTFAADVNQISEEARISGQTERLNWLAGIYYFESKAKNNLDLNINNPDGFVSFLDALAEVDGGFEGGLAALTGYVPGANPAALIPFLTYDVGYTQKTDSFAGFGQLEYNLTDQYSVTLGLRYTTEDRSFNYVNQFGDREGNGTINNGDGVLNSFLYQLSLLGLFPPEYFAFTGNITNDNISGKIGLDYRPNDAMLFFAGYSRGFKSGGFNGGFLDLTDGVVPTDTPYNEEILNSYEIGFKAKLLDNTLRFNATGFYYDYQDYQALTFSGLSQFITNSDAELYGADLELVWLPTENWDLQLGASFLHTNVDQVVVQGVPTTDTEMVLAPQFTLNGLARYEFPLANNRAISFQIDFNHQGDHFFDITNSPVSHEGSYTVFNTRIAYRWNDKLTFALWGKNITGEEYRVYTFDFTGPAGLNQQFFAPPRWFGVSAAYVF
jgi:iron complex outermembrane receptor protein